MEIVDFLKRLFSGNLTVKKEEFDALNLKADESILLHNYHYGMKTWEGNIQGFDNENFKVVFRNVEAKEIPFSEGDTTKSTIIRDGHVVSLFSKLLSVEQNSRFTGYTVTYPQEIEWKKMKSRKHVRVKTDLEARAREPGFDIDEGKWTRIRVKDISESGLCILSPRPFDREKKIFVNVVSDEISQWFRGSITRVDVLDRRNLSGELNYNIGVEFDKLSPHDDEVLNDYIRGRYQMLRTDFPI